MQFKELYVYYFKKKKIIILILALILFLISIFTYFQIEKISNYNPNAYTIVIDAGHGGADGGKVGSYTGVKESEINLAISKMLEKMLKNSGYNVVMTRKDSKMLKGNKNDDMRERKRIILETEPDLMVSIHCNAFPSSSVKGAQVFYAFNSNQGKKYAEIMQNELNDNLNSKRHAAKGDYYILNCSVYPSILVECGFLTNKQEEILLTEGTYQEKVAFTILSGINSIFSQMIEQ